MTYDGEQYEITGPVFCIYNTYFYNCWYSSCRKSAFGIFQHRPILTARILPACIML